MKINLGWGFNISKMKITAKDKTFSSLEDASLSFILETNTVGKWQRAVSADFRLSEQEQGLCYGEAENASGCKGCTVRHSCNTGLHEGLKSPLVI